MFNQKNTQFGSYQYYTKQEEPVEDAWLIWNIRFDNSLPVEEISQEKPLIETFLNHYISVNTGNTSGNDYRFRYNWIMYKKNPRWFNVEIFKGNPAPPNTAAKPAPPNVIMKVSGAYRQGSPNKSDKNTVAVKEPPV